MGNLVTPNGTTCYGFTCYIGNTCARTTWTLEPLVTGLVEPLGPLMYGLLEMPGLAVAGHLVHGQVKEAPLSSCCTVLGYLHRSGGMKTGTLSTTGTVGTYFYVR
jgi:hypothetical protein